jgi:hypothetical protein
MASMPLEPCGCLHQGVRDSGKHFSHSAFLAEQAYRLPGAETWSKEHCRGWLRERAAHRWVPQPCNLAGVSGGGHFVQWTQDSHSYFAWGQSSAHSLCRSKNSKRVEMILYSAGSGALLFLLAGSSPMGQLDLIEPSLRVIFNKSHCCLIWPKRSHSLTSDLVDVLLCLLHGMNLTFWKKRWLSGRSYPCLWWTKLPNWQNLFRDNCSEK